MAVYRQIQVSYWQDPFVISLTPEEKYFYIYLMTNSKTTQCGIYELPKKVMEFETGYNRETVDKLVDRFIQYGKILYHDITQELMLLNWMKHNSMKSPKVRSCVEKELRSIKNNDYKHRFASLCKVYGYPIDSLCIDSGEEEEKEEEKEQEEKEEQEQEENSKSAPVPFYVNSLNSQITEFLKKYKVTYTILDLDNLESFVGLIDLEVIGHAIGLSEGKSGSYATSILKRLASEGKTTMEQVRPTPKVTQIDFKTRSGKPNIDIAHTDTSLVVSDEEYAEMMRQAQEMQENKHNPGA